MPTELYYQLDRLVSQYGMVKVIYQLTEVCHARTDRSQREHNHSGAQQWRTLCLALSAAEATAVRHEL